MSNAASSQQPVFKSSVHKRRFKHLLRPLCPLLSIETGLSHPDFPQTLLHYHLLTNSQLDDLAHFYHQRTPGRYSMEYPMPIVARWWAPAEQELEDGEIDEMEDVRKILGTMEDQKFAKVAGIEEKRRRFGRFLGLRHCESSVGEGDMRREMEEWLAGEMARKEHRDREMESWRSKGHWWLGPPLVRVLWPDAEDAHKGGVELSKKLYRFGLHPRERCCPDDAKDLEIEVFGNTLVNPLGISSGLDKHGEIPTQLLALGPAVVEIGGVTETRQSGNPQPRVFRVTSQRGMLNRYGLNSEGAERVAARLRQRVREFAYNQGYGIYEDAESLVLNGDTGVPPGSLVKGKLLAVQVAKNTSTPDGDTEDIRRDYVRATSLLARYADIIVVNISCPNAPGYRDLQQVESLTRILTGVVGAAASADRKSKPAVMVKAGLDEDMEEQVATICAAVWASGVDGVVVGNTTTLRPERTCLSKTEVAVMEERGGYSGPQLFHRTVSLVKKYRRVLDYPLHEQNQSQQTQLQNQEATDTRIVASFKRDEKNLEEVSDELINQRLIRVPERHPSSRTRGTGPDTAPALSASQHLEHLSTSKVLAQPATFTPKVIFCTGGITNGQQALEVLDAGASVAQIYTALVYGGVGTISSMKQEMRHNIRKSLESDIRGS